MSTLTWIEAGAQAWSAAEDQSAGGWLHTVGLTIAAVVGLLFLFALVRAFTRQDRYRAVKSLGDADLERIREAVRAAEARTVGEILPVVVERSDPHPGAPWTAALVVLLSGSILLAGILPWDSPGLLMACQFGLGALGFVSAKLLPDLARLFVSEGRATLVANEQAFQEFYANDLHKTEAATGVLLFISLFERRVVVMGDTGIDERVESKDWEHTDRVILDGVREGSLASGLVRGIELAGDLLSTHFPWEDGNRNEIPDRVIVRRE